MYRELHGREGGREGGGEGRREGERERERERRMEGVTHVFIYVVERWHLKMSSLQRCPDREIPS